MAKLWVGRVLSGLGVLFLLWDAIMKVIKHPMVIEASKQLGFTEGEIQGIGIVLLICTVLYAIPGPAVLGAVLLTGYLGGAVATNVRMHGPVFNLVFPIIFGVILWLGLALRRPGLIESLWSAATARAPGARAPAAPAAGR